MLITIIFTILLFSVFQSNKVYAMENDNYQKMQISKEDNYYYEDSNILILGNHYELLYDEFKNIKNDSLGKDILVYYINLDKVKTREFIDSHAILFLWDENKYQTSSFKSMTENYDDLIIDINSFVQEKLYEKDLITPEFKTHTNEELFITVYQNEKRFQKTYYGYVDVSYHVKKYRVNDITSLWLVETKSSFTPGYVVLRNASDKDPDSFNWKKYQNHSGFLHMKAYQPKHEIDQATSYPGGTPKYKDAYPVNQPGKVNITSSFFANLNIGYSWKNGFGTSGAESSTEVGVGLNIGYSYSKTYEYPDPRMTAQKSAYDQNEYQWYYEYSRKRGQIETNHLNTGYIFEQNNTGHYLDEDNIGLFYEVKMNVRKTQLIWSWTEETFGGTWFIGYHP